jgi:dihydroxyacetone kinase-like protein
MVDSMTPAVETIASAIRGGDDIPTALANGADAAKVGAESTIDMAAKFGRAKNIGEDSKGFQDAGATSVSLMFKAFADAVA